MPNNVTVRYGSKGNKQAEQDADRLRGKIERLQKTSAKGLVTGIGAGAALAGIGLATSAVSGLTDVIGDSIQAAREDEVSIQRLGSALRANVPAWDGNTDAVERTLKARMALGFSDDEQRDSLARLVVATNDVTKALDIQRTAMDLARLKGISLAEASDALVRIEAGQFRGLKALGIELKKGATQMDALRAVQAAATGQAADYAKTNEGRVLVAQTKVNEAMENLGKAILPPLSTAMEGAGDIADRVSLAFQGWEDASQELAKTLGDLGLVAEEDARKISLLDAVLATMPWAKAAGGADGLGQALLDTIDTSAAAAEALKGAANDIGGGFGYMGAEAEDWRDTYYDATGDIIRRARKVRDVLVDTADEIIGKVFDEGETRAKLHETREELRALETQKRDAKTADEKRHASDRIAAALRDEAEHLNDLGAQGKLTQQDIDRFTADAEKNISSLSKDGQAEIRNLIAQWKALAAMPNISKTFEINEVTRRDRGSTRDTHGQGRGQLEFHDGGWVPGPKGTEVDARLKAGERVLSTKEVDALAGGAGAMSAGGDVHFHVTVQAGIGSGLTPGAARQLTAEIGPALYADMQRRGFLPRSHGLHG